MIFAKFKLLMWKTLRLRRYHWMVTSVEFLLPILVAYLLTTTASSMSGVGSVEVPATIYPTVKREELLSVLNSTKLYYAPWTTAVEKFMDQIKSDFKSVSGYPNETYLESVLQNQQEVPFEASIGIHFKNIVPNSKDSLPDKLSYALRSTSELSTRNLYAPIFYPGPSFLYSRFYLQYAPVQIILNENFIKIKTSRNELSQVQLLFEGFPYPQYVMDGRPRVMTSAVIGVFVTITILIISIPLINDIIEEKDSGVKELLKISGLNEWMIWCSWFVHAIMISLVSFSITLWILTHPFNGPGSEAIHFIQYSVLWVYIILYCIANISLCFMFSSIFHKAGIASSVFVICFILLFCGFAYLSFKGTSPLIMKLFTLTPVGALILGFRRLQYYEIQGIEFTWSSVTLAENDDKLSLLFCMLMLLLDTFVYFFLTYYITSINPGKFGTRKSPLFIFQSLFSSFFKKNPKELKLPIVENGTESRFFELPLTNLETTIQIRNLHKQFGSVQAVNGVNLNIYKGEMTALLGHNGAGKTTTMSIMTGLTSPTSGSIYFKDMDVLQNMEEFRRHMGMCPQENRTMPYLSVMDHLLFFGQLKGVSRKEAEIEANEYLTMMDMQAKKKSLAKALSGGMKRKLCLSIALMGKAQVLILDEPTSGMDVQSRRKLWDLLLGLRVKRTIIFTTHYMEEADALGDRIAIMNHGLIVCYGTPIFLKKAYGTGYELTITKIHYEDGQSTGVDQIIKNIIPEATLEYESPTEVVYKLPLTETVKFSNLFKSLESKMVELGIKNMGVASTTLEQVFLKVGGTSVPDVKSSKNTTAFSTGELKHLNHIKGISLTMQQVGALLMKHFLYTSRNKFSILTRVVIPTLIGLFMLNLIPKSVTDRLPEPSLDLSMSIYPGSTVLMRDNGGSSNFEKHLSEYVTEKGGSFVKAQKADIEQELLDHARKDIFKYNRNYLSAFECNATSTKLLNNLKLLHSLPVTITSYSNVLLRSITGDHRFEIETSNHLVQTLYDGRRNQKSCGRISEIAQVAYYFLWFGAAAFYTVDLISYFSSFVNMERIDGFYHIQMMSNVSPFLYWCTTFLFDLVLFLIIMAVRVGIFKMLDDSKLFGIDPSLGVMALIIILYGVSGLLFIFVTGYLSNSKEGSYTLLFIFNLICGIAVSIFYQAEKYEIYRDTWMVYQMLFYLSKGLIWIVPSLNFCLLFIKLMVIFNENSVCESCSGTLKRICEGRLKKKTYLEFPSKINPDGLMIEIVFSLIDIILYSVILSLINMGYVPYWWEALKNVIFGTGSTNSDVGDNDVQQELHEVQQYKSGGRRANENVLLVDGLRKNYINWFKPFTAVSNVSFVVQPGQCFGLLGVNGAGKSTSFKILTGEILPTLGDSSIDGVKLSASKKKYLSMAGYCPQTNCFIEVLTGREMLSMIAAMRGVSSKGNQTLVNKWITIMGLEEFQYQRCGTYSGGNKRKLCTVMSLIGDPRVVFLDEPTSGVDPVSRRNLYDVMGRSKQAGQAVILTSHSLEECETLCDRITIMKAGVMKCIGSAQDLKRAYAQGFSVLIKIKDISDGDSYNHLRPLKENMSSTFDPDYCVLKDEHKGLLYYQIKDTTLSWSTLFEKMEAIKHIHREIVDDYVLSDTTLEEVFMFFAQE